MLQKENKGRKSKMDVNGWYLKCFIMTPNHLLIEG